MTADDTQPFLARLPAPLYEQLRRAAFERRIAMNRIVVAAIEKELGNEDR